MAATKDYVRVDECGVRRVGQTRVSLDSVVYAFRDGCSAEAIRDSYQALSLEEVYGAIAYYLANTAEVDDYLREQERLADELRARLEANPSPVVERLRKLKREQEAAARRGA